MAKNSIDKYAKPVKIMKPEEGSICTGHILYDNGQRLNTSFIKYINLYLAKFEISDIIGGEVEFDIEYLKEFGCKIEFDNHPESNIN